MPVRLALQGFSAASLWSKKDVDPEYAAFREKVCGTVFCQVEANQSIHSLKSNLTFGTGSVATIEAKSVARPRHSLIGSFV